LQFGNIDHNFKGTLCINIFTLSLAPSTQAVNS
jgi:hypothetical protein